MIGLALGQKARAQHCDGARLHMQAPSEPTSFAHRGGAAAVLLISVLRGVGDAAFLHSWARSTWDLVAKRIPTRKLQRLEHLRSLPELIIGPLHSKVRQQDTCF